MLVNYVKFSAVYRLRHWHSTAPRTQGVPWRPRPGCRMTKPDTPISGKSIVLVGLMGAGKTSVGRRLAHNLDMPFIDADEEIAKAAGCSIGDIFEIYGETAFRDGERRVIMRLLDGEPRVLATGGGAFMDSSIRSSIGKRGITVWLRVGLDTLVRRTRRRNDRPLLKGGSPRDILERLMAERYPIYAEANIVIDPKKNETPEKTARRVIRALESLPQEARP